MEDDFYIGSGGLFIGPVPSPLPTDASPRPRPTGTDYAEVQRYITRPNGRIVQAGQPVAIYFSNIDGTASFAGVLSPGDLQALAQNPNTPGSNASQIWAKLYGGAAASAATTATASAASSAPQVSTPAFSGTPINMLGQMSGAMMNAGQGVGGLYLGPPTSATATGTLSATLPPGTESAASAQHTGDIDPSKPVAVYVKTARGYVSQGTLTPDQLSAMVNQPSASGSAAMTVFSQYASVAYPPTPVAPKFSGTPADVLGEMSSTLMNGNLGVGGVLLGPASAATPDGTTSAQEPSGLTYADELRGLPPSQQPDGTQPLAVYLKTPAGYVSLGQLTPAQIAALAVNPNTSNSAASALFTKATGIAYPKPSAASKSAASTAIGAAAPVLNADLTSSLMSSIYRNIGS